MATLLGGKIINSSGTSPILGSASNLGTINKNALTNASAGINPNATPAAVFSSGLKFGQANQAPAPVVPTPAPAKTTAPVKTTPKAALKNTTAAATAPAPAVPAQAAPAPTPSPSAEMVSLKNTTTGQTVSVSKADWEQNPAYKDTNSPWKLLGEDGMTEGNKVVGAEPAAPENTTPTVEKPDSSAQITSLLQQGYDNPLNIATATGLTVDEVNNFLNSNENASYMLSINKNDNEQDLAYREYRARMDQITNGTFALTDSEQADIKDIQERFDRLRRDQITANKNYEGAVTTAEIRSGRQEFMNQISSGIFKQAVDQGVDRIKQIESDAVAQVRAYKQAVQDKNYKAASEAYNSLNKYLDDKSTAIKDLHTATVDEYKRQQDVIKSAQDRITQDLQNQKLKQDIATSTVESITPALSGATPEIIDAVAKYYNIDANVITGSLKSETQKFDKEMIAKGFRTINPADVEKMRALGAEVYEYQGRAYMKEPELKSVTNKGNIDFFRGTKKVGTSPLTGGGPVDSSTTTSEEKDIKAFNDDMRDARQKVAAGTWTLQDARNYAKSQYDLTDEAAAVAFPDYSEE